MKKILLKLFVVTGIALLPIAANAQIVVSNFGAGPTAINGWAYDSGTSTVTGDNGSGDIFQLVSTNIGSLTDVRLTGAFTGPVPANDNFILTLFDQENDSVTASFDFGNFSGGGTIVSSLSTNAAFSGNLSSWLFTAAGSPEAISMSFTSLEAIPEPSTYALLGVGVIALVVSRRLQKRKNS